MKKLSIAGGIIMLVGGLLVLWQQSRVELLKEKLAELHQDVARKAHLTQGSGSSEPRTQSTKKREGRQDAAAKLRRLLVQAKAIENEGGRPDESLRDEVVVAAVELMKLSPALLQEILLELTQDSGISENNRAGLVCDVLMAISSSHPEYSLKILDGSRDLFSKRWDARRVVCHSVQSWAGQNPEAALQWLQKRKGLPGEMQMGDISRPFLTGMVGSGLDLTAVFELQSEMGWVERSGDFETIVDSGLNVHGLEKLLRAKHEHAMNLGETNEARKFTDGVMAAVGNMADKIGHEAMTRRFDTQSLSESELVAFTRGLQHGDSKNTGAWMTWMESRLSGEKLAESTEGMMRRWVQKDHQAAGNWLRQLPDGSLTNPAVKAYAAEVARVDPQAATQWALTLSDPKARLDTLMAIRDHWPDGDQEGAIRFTEQHGLD